MREKGCLTRGRERGLHLVRARLPFQPQSPSQPKMSPAYVLIGGCVVLTLAVGIVVLPKAVDQLEDWLADRKERKRQKEEAAFIAQQDRHRRMMASSAGVMRARASGREDRYELNEVRLRHRHSVSTLHPTRFTPLLKQPGLLVR